MKGEVRNFDTIILEKEASIATLTLNRPDVLNTINRQMFDELVEAMADIACDSELMALVITGAGRAFSAGGNRTEHPLES
jgi:enoyl-CoA hydratase